MHTEIEIRILEVDKEKLEEKIKKVNGEFVYEYYQRRYVYDTNPKKDKQWFRLRDTGKEVTLTYKNIEKNSIDGTKELEIEVDDFENTHLMMEKLGYEAKAYQENKRTRYMLDGVEIDIDSWPLIPTYVELEGPSAEAVYQVLEKLELSKEKAIAIGVKEIFANYGIDLDTIVELKF